MALSQVTMGLDGAMMQYFDFNHTHVNNTDWKMMIPKHFDPHSLNITPDYACELIGLHEGIIDDVRPIVVASFYICLILIGCGLIGNTLSIVVFSSREMRIVSSNVYLLLLAISDSLYLIAVFVTNSLKTMQCLYSPAGHIDFHNHSQLACKVLQHMLDLFSNYSSCLILAFTLERYIAIYMPVQFKWLCNVRRARCVCTTIFLVIATTIAPYHYIMIGVVSESCVVITSFEHLFTTYYMLETVTYRILPVFVIAGLNTAIICRVMQLRRKRNQRRNLSMSMTTSVVTALTNVERSTTGVNKQFKRKTPSEKAATPTQKKADRSMQLTIILLLVSASYVVCYLPVLITFIVTKLAMSRTLNIERYPLVVLQCVTRTLYILGFAINFLLYTMSGRVFREQLETIVCSTWRRLPPLATRSSQGRVTSTSNQLPVMSAAAAKAERPSLPDNGYVTPRFYRDEDDGIKITVL